ncbi:MAG: hypothetical protein JSU92_14985 [Deltaproteobacteria bacterium]|nr:MAG: hypothetical protein JSU92_14985 [Deltaproteobacteria bacterium]
MQVKIKLIQSILIAAIFLSILGGKIAAYNTEDLAGRVEDLLQEEEQKEIELKALEEMLKDSDRAVRSKAIEELSRVDGERAKQLWQIVLNDQDKGVKKNAWEHYDKLREDLDRKALHRVILIHIPGEVAQDIFKKASLDIILWEGKDSFVIGEGSAYTIEKLKKLGCDVDVLYSSISEWQEARKEYEISEEEGRPSELKPPPEPPREPEYNFKIMIFDLTKTGEPAEGYTQWLDRESIMMKNNRYLALESLYPKDHFPELIEDFKQRGFYIVEIFDGTEDFLKNRERYFPE